MWHMYSKDATGVVLELDKKEIERALATYGNNDTTSVRLGECRYEQTIEETVLDSYVNAITKMAEYGKNIFHIIRIYSLGIKDNMVLHKSPDYEYEKEWRIYARSNEIYTKVSNGQIKPYVEITLPISCLKSIKIGPCMPNKEQELQAIKYVLNRKLINLEEFDISNSKITSYRNNM
jgi:hypothetical protein